MHTVILTGDTPVASSKSAITDSDDKTTGISVTWDSEEPCPSEQGATTSFTAIVECDKLQSSAGEAIIKNVDRSDECNPVVTVSHSAGCPIQTASDMTIWLSDNPWVYAVLLLVVGPVIALFGKKWFPYVAGITSGLFVGDAVAHFAGWMEWYTTSWSPYVVAAVAIFLGFLVGNIVARKIWFAVGLLGIVAGLSLGTMIFAIIAATTGYATNWELLLLCIACSFVGGFVTFKWGREVVILATSLVGSYIFMRGWTFIYDGYPHETEIWSNMKHNEDLGLTNAFWGFMAVWLISFVVSATVQFKAMDEHEDLKEHYTKVQN